MNPVDDEGQPISTWQYTTADGEIRADLAWTNYWRKAFVYSGRATRAEYNWAIVMVAIVFLVLAAGTQVLVSSPVAFRVIEIVLLVLLATPWFALIARRCHDMNRRGTFGLLMVVPGVGFIVASGFMILGDSDPRGIRFDPPPPTKP